MEAILKRLLETFEGKKKKKQNNKESSSLDTCGTSVIMDNLTQRSLQLHGINLRYFPSIQELAFPSWCC